MMMLCIETSLSVIVRSKSSLQCLYCKLNLRSLAICVRLVYGTIAKSEVGKRKKSNAASKSL